MSRSVRVRFAQVDLPGWPYHAMLRRAERLEKQAQAMIDGKRAAGGPGHDVLSLLLQGHGESNATVSAEELVGETITLVAAGSETTASSLVWTLFLLSQHPAVAEEVAHELESKLRGRLPAPEQLDELTALDAVIRESLRLLPPGFHSSRKAIGPFELGRYAIAKGTTVAFSPYITHRRADLYPQPLRFQPERWLHIKPSMYEYLPFGAGPHSCIGASLALTTMKIALAVILQRCQLALVPGADISRKTTITLWPKYGMPMVVHGPGEPCGGGRARGDIHEMVELP
jgi:cytochrome P450